MRRLLLVLGAFAAMSPLYALPPGEFPLAPLPLGFAPYDRQNVHVAANDSIALAVWEDFRVDPAQPPRIWAARMNRETTKVLDPTGFIVAKLPPNSQLRDVATDGTDFLVAWTEADRLRLARVTAAGEVIVAPATNVTAQKVSIVFIGTFGYAVFAGSPTAFPLERTDAIVLVVDRGGHVTRPPVVAVASDGVVDLDAAASANLSRLFLVWSDLADGDVHAAAFNTFDVAEAVFAPASSVGQTVPPHNAPPVVRMATNGSEMLAAWNDVESNPSVYRVRRFDGNGNPLGPAAVLAPPPAVGASTDVVWDGAQYIVGFKADDNALRAVRFAPDGSRIDVTPLLAAQPAVNGFALAVSPGFPDTLVTWLAAGANGAQVMAHLFSQTGSIAVAPQDLGLSQSFADRSDAVVVWRGDHYLGAWRDTTNLSRAVVGRFSADGQPIDGTGVSISVGAFAAVPSLASNGRTAFIAWRDSNGVAGSFIDEGGGVQRRFFDFHGGAPSVNWNGQQYAVVWRSTTGDLLGLRFRGDGSIIDQQAVTIAPASGDPVIGWTGNSYVAVYPESAACAPFCDPETQLWAQLISPSLTAIGSRIQLSDPTAGTPSVGSGPAGALVVWARATSGVTDLRAVRVVNGAVLDPRNGLLVGDAAYATVYGTAAGWGVVSGPTVWDVARNGAITPPILAFPFVPAGARSSVVLGGPAPLVVYRREPSGSEQMKQVVAHFVVVTQRRERAARP